MSEIKIPNCPCCDGESKLHDYGGGDFRDGGKQYFIKCEECGLTTKHSSSKDEVLMKWGKRKTIERIIERLKVLHDLVKMNQKLAVSQAMDVVKEEGGVE